MGVDVVFCLGFGVFNQHAPILGGRAKSWKGKIAKVGFANLIKPPSHISRFPTGFFGVVGFGGSLFSGGGAPCVGLWGPHLVQVFPVGPSGSSCFGFCFSLTLLGQDAASPGGAREKRKIVKS